MMDGEDVTVENRLGENTLYRSLRRRDEGSERASICRE